AVARQGGASGVRARSTVDRAAGVGRGTGEVKAVDRRVRATETRHGPEKELLVDRRGAAVDRASHETRVVGGELGRALEVAGDDPVAETRCLPFDRVFD